MTSKFLKLFLSLLLISSIISIPSFTISVLNKRDTACVNLNNSKEPSFQFGFIGTPIDVEKPITFAFYLDAPANGVARCSVFPPEKEDEDTYVYCFVDGFFYELGKNKPITLPDTLPEYDNIKIKGWEKFLAKNGKYITKSANCNDPEFQDGVAFESTMGTEIKYFKCLFWFDAHVTKGTLKTESEDLYFSLNVDVNEDDTIEYVKDIVDCTIPMKEKTDDGNYKVYCAYKGPKGRIKVSDYSEAKIPIKGNSDVYVLGEFLPTIDVDSCSQN